MGRDLLLLLLLSDPDTNTSSIDATIAFISSITYVESVFDNTIQVDLMLMQIHPIILFLSTVNGTNTDAGSITTNSTMMILCC
mmetsp:Transcript_11268/g.12659  ORF Transcript_11268/g.12659 Transcript_11268/m.12659 type:complete len:83 (-) Transcript_11268:39-287(-)